MLATARRSCLGFALLSLALTASAQKVPDVRVDGSDSPASSESYKHALAVVGSSVYAVWANDPAAPGIRGDIYFNRSHDSGTTWLASPIRIDRGGAPNDACATNPDVAVSGSSVFAAWMDGRGFEGSIRFNCSFDGGLTWGPEDVRIDRGDLPLNFCNGYFPRIHASGSSVYVVWGDLRNGESGIYFTRSLDAGSTWLPSEVRLDVGSPPGAAITNFDKTMAAEGEALYVVWEDLRNGMSDVYFNRSLDGGATWLPQDVRVSIGAPPSTTNVSNPEIAVSGDSVYVVWQENRTAMSVQDVYFNRSLDGGVTWLSDSVRLNVGQPPGTTHTDYPHIAASGDAVYVAWSDSRSGSWDVYFNRSLDYGTTWLATEVRLDVGSAPGSSISFQNECAAAGSAVYVAWQDYRSGDAEAFLNRSTDWGATWLVQDVRLNVGGARGTAAVQLPRLGATESACHAIWQDFRDGMGHIYYNLALGHQPYGYGAPGSGGLVPILTAAGPPATGSTFTLVIEDGLGGASAAVLYGLDGPAAIPVLGGFLLIAPPLFGEIAQLGGAPGVAGAGFLDYPVQVPNDVSLVGARVNMQAAVFDPAAKGGLSLTAGIEVWIL